MNLTNTDIPADLDHRFRRAASEEGLLDVAYEVTESPLGSLLLAATARGLCRISFDPDPEDALEELAASYGVRVLRSPRPLDEVRRELDEYFTGSRTAFSLPLDLEGLAPFQRVVLNELRHVPYGRTTTYGGLATRVGKPSAARAVGGALNRNPVPIVLPCHRVVGAGGALVGYGGGLERKQALLSLEGAIL